MDRSGDDLEPVGVGDVLEFAFRVYRQRFGTLVRAAAVVVIPLWFLSAVVLAATPAGEALSPPAEAPGATDPADPLGDIDASELAGLVGAVVLAGALSLTASQLSTAAAFLIVTGTYLGVERTWQESVAFAWRRLGPLLWLQLIYTVLLVFGFIAFVVPGIYLAVAWAVAVPVLLFEDRRGFGALRRSRELLRGRWWPTAGLLMFVALITSIFQAALGAVFSFLVSGSGSEASRNFAEAVAGLVGAVVAAPFTAAIITVLFFDALVRKDGFGVDDLALGVGMDPPPAPPFDSP